MQNQQKNEILLLFRFGYGCAAYVVGYAASAVGYAAYAVGYAAYAGGYAAYAVGYAAYVRQSENKASTVQLSWSWD